MAWGILEEKSGLAHVPATVLLSEETPENAAHSEHLKKTTYRGTTIVLVPQPSDDPNDPLNWPLWSRDLLFLLLGACTIVAIGGVGPILSPLTIELVTVFDVTLTDVSLLTGYNLCATGAVGIFISAIAHKYGKRLPLMFSMTFAFASTLWGGFATSYNSLLGARIVQGLSIAMFESIIFSIVGDLYFVHERGVRVAVTTACIAGIANLPPVLAGKIATELGWRWAFWLLSIFIGIFLILCFFFGWETAFKRSAIYNIDLTSQDSNNLGGFDAKEVAREVENETTKNEPSNIAHVETATSSTTTRKSFLQRLKLYSTTYTDESLLKLIIKPFAIVYNPVVIWAILLMSFPTLWLVGINILVGEIFAGSPYFLTTAELGYMSAGPTVGGFIGAIVAGAMSDPIIRYLSHRNNGIFEPEFRLLLAIPATIMSTIGYFLFGSLIEDGKSPVGAATLWGLSTASLQFVMIVVGSYCVDAYRDISVEIFIITMVVKNFIFFGFSFILNDWLTAWGAARLFYCAGGIQIGLCLTTVPLYIYGKRLRAWWHNAAIER